MLTQNSDLLQDNWEAINDFENNHSSIIIPSLGKNILTFIFNLLGTLGIYSFFMISIMVFRTYNKKHGRCCEPCASKNTYESDRCMSYVMDAFFILISSFKYHLMFVMFVLAQAPSDVSNEKKPHGLRVISFPFPSFLFLICLITCSQMVCLAFVAEKPK